MDQPFEAFPGAEKQEPVEEEPTTGKKSINPTSLSWGFKTKEVRVTRIPNHFQAKKTENLLILVAFSIGLGSIWRFPYLCHHNGGGSFLLLYVLLLLLLGIPLMYMEMIIGQWLRMDNIRVWKQLVPCLSGVGYSSLLACILVSLYNSALMSWSLFYLGHSFDYPLSWEHCSFKKVNNRTDLACLRTVPYQYFWYNTALFTSTELEEGIEVLVLDITLCLFVTWILLYVTMITRIKISVLMLIFSIFFPYVLLLCFFIRSLFLEGAMAGLRRLVATELSILASLDTWRQAGGHVLYSLGLGMGTIITFSSYQTRGDNYIKLVSFVVIVNLVTSLLSTAIIFLLMGFWASTSGSSCVEKSVSNLVSLIAKGVLSQAAWPPKDIVHRPPLEYLDWISHLPMQIQQEVVYFSLPCSILVQKEKFMEGPGLSYVAFSQAVSLFPGSAFWAIIFFLALVIMSLSTMITLLQGIMLPLQHSISTFTKYPKLVPVVVCLGGLLGSLVFTSRPGSYMVFLIDEHLVPMVLVIIVVFQNLSLAWVYGAKRFRAEMFGQLGRLVWAPFSFLWSYVTMPTLLALLTIYFLNLYHSESLYYITWNNSVSQEVKQPYSKMTLSWVTFLSLLALLPIPVYPLQHWWYLDDNSCELLEDPVSSKKMVPEPNKVTQWPMQHLKRPTLRSLNKSKSSFQGKSTPEASFIHPPKLLEKQDSECYSTFSYPGGSLPEALRPTVLSAGGLGVHSTGRKGGARGFEEGCESPAWQQSGHLFLVTGDVHQASTCPMESRKLACRNPAQTSGVALWASDGHGQLRSPSSSSMDTVPRAGPGPPHCL